MESAKDFLKCSSATDANKLAGSIYASYQKADNQGEDIVIRVIGAGALNQATKAVIVSNKYFANQGIRVDIRPSFIESGGMTAINLKLLFNKV